MKKNVAGIALDSVFAKKLPVSLLAQTEEERRSFVPWTDRLCHVGLGESRGGRPTVC